jgi:hypothetical protein
MDTRRDDFMDHGAARRGGLLWLVAALLSFVLIVVLGATLVLDALHAGRRPQAIATGLLALMALLLCYRFVHHRWALWQMPAVAAPPGSEETGIWGVGGPAMRMPGTTQLFGPMSGRRSTDHHLGEDDRSR